VATARAGNVIGGGDWSTDRLVPDLVRSFLASRPAAIRNPGAVRPWQHVLDPLHGYLELAERLATEGPGYAEAWNFGPNPLVARTVAWLADRACGLWPWKVEWHVTQETQPHETPALYLDSAKAMARLGWAPALDLEEAIGLTLDWYVAYAEGMDVAELTRGQTQGFLNRVSSTSVS
jgi:CDP-glucose 4,6-dehydratase